MSADAVELSFEELRSLAGWAAGWAAAALPRFEQAVPGDGRPRAAIDAATAFAAGAPRSKALRTAALDAYRAARETADPAASHAASAAYAAAGSAFSCIRSPGPHRCGTSSGPRRMRCSRPA
ncbi:MAG: putative immunity protein [Amnibacterium sp.]